MKMKKFILELLFSAGALAILSFLVTIVFSRDLFLAIYIMSIALIAYFILSILFLIILWIMSRIDKRL